ncbi:hypothetical protein SMNI109538_01300 [Smaragdicoccus niigatensis]|uniref:DUF7373 family lipoprotein n=1 Tax=Smaragdicoccus niigatensis TaxID=359359 RepID=UPI0003A4E738
MLRHARTECYVTFDRYVTTLASADEADVKQRAAALHALLVNPTMSSRRWFK